VTANKPNLFADRPAIDRTGRLTFTPAFNVNGTAAVTVRLQDSGDGNNTSPPQTFLIAITKPHPGHNARNRLDTNNDGFVSPIDAVLVINLINNFGSGPIAQPFLPGIVIEPGFYPDVDGDNFVSPVDAVLVINVLNATAAASASGTGSSAVQSLSQASGEAETVILNAAPLGSDDGSRFLGELDSLLDLLAHDEGRLARHLRSASIELKF
jgi:hypothetical protein